MYRLPTFLLICSLIAFVPALVLAQDKDAPAKGDDKGKTEDKGKDGKEEKLPPPATAKANGDKPPATEKKDEAAVPVAAPQAGFGRWPWLNSIASVVEPLVAIFILAIIAIVLMGLRSDINRLVDQMLAQSGSEEKKD